MEENEINIIPYFNVYTADFKVFKEKLSNQEIVEILNAISDLCLYAETDYKPKTKYQAIWFNKLKNDFDKNLSRYKSCVTNGKKGGRPRKINPDETQEKPMGFLGVNPNETQPESIKYNKIEYNKIKKNNIDIYCNKEFEKCFDIYKEVCTKLTPLRFERRSKAILEELSSFLDEIEYNFDYFKELCEKANQLEKIVDSKIDFKTMIKNHIGITNGKYDKKEQVDISKYFV